PDTSPPPPKGTNTAATSGRSSAISNPIVPFPAITVRSATGCTNVPAMPFRPWSASVCHHSSYGTYSISPPRPATASLFLSRAETRDGFNLRLRRRVRHDHRARNTECSCAPRDALRHVARARRVHAVAQRLPRQHRDGVRCPAELERTDRLQRLEFEVDLGGR